MTTQENVVRMRVWRKTKSDAEAAKLLGMKKPAFAMWRRTHKLKSKGKVGRPKHG